ncbi:MAG: CYTH and CHAD domain-containing protein [Micrococcales bacterium]|nr:CYTH and CHAD domain-containing protein [Micrococcales bacterium]
MEQVEHERKFAVDTGQELPDLGEIVTLGEQRRHQLSATYLDTVDLALIRAKVTLRRRVGGADAGWHLKLPREDGTRLEVHAPLTEGVTPARVPGGHRAGVAVIVGRAPLVPAAVLETVRLETDLLDAGGQVVAQLCDDTVTVHPSEESWRELEIELVGSGDAALLDRITERFATAGIDIAAFPSKLSRALGDRPAKAQWRADKGARHTPKTSAAEVLWDYVGTQVGVIQALEHDVRADASDAVHKSRVAARRLRSALRTFRPILDRSVTDPLRDELRWLGEILGGPRDAEVLKERLTERVQALPPELVVGPVAKRVATELDATHDRARSELLREMDGERYAALCDALVRLVIAPPVRPKAERKAAKVLPALVAAADRRVDRAWQAARQAEGEERHRLLHETRKKAKAARYASEALADAFGEPAAELARLWEGVTDGLGQVQDGAVALARLRELCAAAEAAGESGFTYGALAAHDLIAAHQAEREGIDALRRASAKGPRAWTRG